MPVNISKSQTGGRSVYRIDLRNQNDEAVARHLHNVNLKSYPVELHIAAAAGDDVAVEFSPSAVDDIYVEVVPDALGRVALDFFTPRLRVRKRTGWGASRVYVASVFDLDWSTSEGSPV